jgi:serine/threonine-protein kinase
VLPPTLDLSTGTLFQGRYEILGPLGRGGMGIVYKARDRSLDEVVAIKVLRPDSGQDPKMGDRFRSEIKLARRVRHRNVCAIHDYGEDRGFLFISMEYIEGTDLRRLLRERGPISSDEGFDIAIQIAEGLQAVHEAGIIHRDLKSANIMCDSHGVARLMDFGIAKRQGDGTLTATGNILGTPEYMSPEQAQGQKLDPRTDIYALGVVTYEIFTGKVPFRGDTPLSIILKHLNDPPPLDGPSAKGLTPNLRSVLKKALAKEPAERYSTAREFADALRQARSLPGVPEKTGPSRWVWGAAGLAATGVAVALALHRPAQAPPQPAVVSPTTLPPSTLPEPTPSPSAPPKEVVAPPSTLRVPERRQTPPPPSARPTPQPEATPEPPKPVRTAAPAPEPGFLLILAHPWARVTVDGRALGETPLDMITLTSGEHTLRLRHPNYEEVERHVTIRPGETARMTVDFPTEGVRKHN